ncbi:hypothetical protein KUTeg_012577 [Tegillarca granosa]|uniref:Uncharacterized protein n=1 Tax=Tegillarca granosa TaxID=220873 RepID=A0ABQ9F3A7_TEGGR|nr:hypothetical protein KUTeg_012577 [Tegillarca granosa]
MTLKPILKSKVDELFLRWLSEPDTQQILKENLRQLVSGEAFTQPSPSPSGSRGTGKSPRGRPVSPPTAKLPSPRSPRRPLSSKNNHRGHGGGMNGLNGGSKKCFGVEFPCFIDL